ncbi:MAG TPA: hypothetical protein VM369_02445 [Candidatus Binatia bacterium]|nr:hypothetical protein [Candidatus Binatia bacterium]
MSGVTSALTLSLALVSFAAPADTRIVIRVQDDVGLPPAKLAAMVREYTHWAHLVYGYNEVHDPAPVTLHITRKVPVAMYGDGVVDLPPDDDAEEMLESWVHELTHHATGQDSSFFFKEGIATHTLEALLLRQRRVPAGWPNYGQACDAWVALYRERGRWIPLREALAWAHYDGSSAEADFRSWQLYNIAGSFVGWYVARHGYAHFREAFRKEWPAEDSFRLEQAWLADVAARKPERFDPAAALPPGERYRGFATRLRPAPAPPG